MMGKGNDKRVWNVRTQGDRQHLFL